MTTGENIRRIRKERGYTQKRLADKCEMYESQIRKYELDKANPKIETLEKIAAALDCAVSDIRGFDGSIRVKITPEGIEFDRLMRKRQANEDFTEQELQWLNNYFKSHNHKDAFNRIGESIKALMLQLVELQGAYSQLNRTGKDEAVKRVKELTEIPRYTEQDAPPEE